MIRDYQIEPLRRLLENPMIQSGLYLVDTELDDDELGAYLEGIGNYAYHKGPLMPTKDSTVLELLVLRLSCKFENEEIKDMRKYLLSDATKQRDNVLLCLLVQMMICLSAKQKVIIHLCGELDLTSLIHEELCMLKEALTDNKNPIVIVSKKRCSKEMKCDSLLTIITLSEEKRYRLMENRTAVVHFSYKHDAAFEDAMKAIENGLKKNNIPFSKDEYDLMYRSNIDDYEKEIGASDRVIMFVIPSYLKSLDCMFEMTQMFKKGNVRERIFPVVNMGEIARNSEGLKEIKDYWQGEKIRKTDQIKDEPGGSTFVLGDIQKIDDILKTMDDFWFFLCREYTGNYHKLIENDASLLIDELKKTFTSVDKMPTYDSFEPTGETQPVFIRKSNQFGEKSVYIEHNIGNITIN